MTATATQAPAVGLHPQRIAVRLPLRSPIADLEPAIAVFHRCLQRGWLEGQLIDVADYRHVPQGPGVMVVGHDVDLSLTQDALLLTRKRSADHDAATQVADLLRMAAVAVEALAYDGTLPLDADLGRVTVLLLDRLLDASGEQLAEAVAPALARAWGTDVDPTPAQRSDPREPLAVVAEAGTAVDAAAVVDRLGGSRAPMQSPWDVTVEQFAELREQDGVVVLDVREESEHETANLGGTLLPLAQLPERLDELDRGAKVVVHCRAGIRGGKAVRILRDAGFADAWNVNGALVAWSERIDPSIRVG